MCLVLWLVGHHKRLQVWYHSGCDGVADCELRRAYDASLPDMRRGRFEGLAEEGESRACEGYVAVGCQRWLSKLRDNEGTYGIRHENAPTTMILLFSAICRFDTI